MYNVTKCNILALALSSSRNKAVCERLCVCVRDKVVCDILSVTKLYIYTVLRERVVCVTKLCVCDKVVGDKVVCDKVLCDKDCV